MSNVPARVAAEAAAADVQLAELAQAAANGTLEPPGPPQPTNPTPPPAPPAPPVPPAPPAPTAQPVDQTALLQQLQQQANTLDGRLRAETAARLRAERELAELQRNPPQPPTPPAPPTPAPAPVSEQERADFGGDTVDFITKIATHVATQVGNQLGARLAAVEGRLNATSQQVQQVARVEQQTAQERFLAALQTAVPDWEAINFDDDFLAWLQNIEQASNKPYMELLTAAHEKGHAGPVIHIFNTYKQSKGIGPAQAPPPPSPSQPSGHIDPASLAAPSTAAPPAPPSGQPPQAKIWTQGEVDKLYDDYQKKRISQAVFTAKEAEYMQALVEGRVAAS